MWKNIYSQAISNWDITMNNRIDEIQYITRDSDVLSHSVQACRIFEQGFKWVQIRMKNHSNEEMKIEAIKALEAANKANAKLILNDSVELAKEIKAHGVHLGLKDMKVSDARAILGNEVIIGGTANTYEDIIHQKEQGADYIGLGPLRFTETKKKLSAIIGYDGYIKIFEKLKQNNIDIPIVAVGGIDLMDIKLLKKIGLTGVAMSGALYRALLSY